MKEVNVGKGWVAFSIAILIASLIFFSLKTTLLYYLIFGFLYFLTENDWTRPWLIFTWLPGIFLFPKDDAKRK